MNTVSRMLCPWDRIGDDIAELILMRVSPHPVCIARIAGVCHEWRRLVRTAWFLKQLSKLHGGAPLLGFFNNDTVLDRFEPVGPAPDVPSRIFSLPTHDSRGRSLPRLEVLGCRHGRVLLLCGSTGNIRVWDPITRQLDVNFFFLKNEKEYHGTVLCVADHVHGHCHSSPWLVAFIDTDKDSTTVRSWSSVAGSWGQDVVTPTVGLVDFRPATLIGTLCIWHTTKHFLLSYDHAENSLQAIKLPEETANIYRRNITVVSVDGSSLGVAALTENNMTMTIRIWMRVGSVGEEGSWVLSSSIPLRELIPGKCDPPRCRIVCAMEGSSVIMIRTPDAIYSVDYVRKTSTIIGQGGPGRTLFPYSSFFIAGLEHAD